MSNSSTVAEKERKDGDLQTLLDDTCAGYRLSDEEALLLFSVSDRKVWEIARAADERREMVVGNRVTYVLNQNINVTNYCINSCGFCGFSRKPGDEEGYYYNLDQVRKKLLSQRKGT